jgi:hypothetical protein
LQRSNSSASWGTPALNARVELQRGDARTRLSHSARRKSAGNAFNRPGVFFDGLDFRLHDRLEWLAYERRGLGHDTTTKPPPIEEPTKRLSIDMPQSLHRRFKSACARSGLAMIDEVMALIKSRTAELERS